MIGNGCIFECLPDCAEENKKTVVQILKKYEKYSVQQRNAFSTREREREKQVFRKIGEISL